MSERTNSRTSRRKSQRQLRMKRILLTACLMVLVAVVSIGGTIAWLQDGTETITNTFAPTGIEISLDEKVEEGIEDNTFPLIPGKSYTKDPVVAVDNETNVDVYLFVKFEETGEPGEYFNYTSLLNTENGWTELTGSDVPDSVWYRIVKTTDSTKSWNLLGTLNDNSEKQIKVKEDLEESDMPTSEEEVQLKYTAYAIQTAGFETANEAWEQISTSAAEGT